MGSCISKLSKDASGHQNMCKVKIDRDRCLCNHNHKFKDEHRSSSRTPSARIVPGNANVKDQDGFENSSENVREESEGGNKECKMMEGTSSGVCDPVRQMEKNVIPQQVNVSPINEPTGQTEARRIYSAPAETGVLKPGVNANDVNYNRNPPYFVMPACGNEINAMPLPQGNSSPSHMLGNQSPTQAQFQTLPPTTQGMKNERPYGWVNWVFPFPLPPIKETVETGTEIDKQVTPLEMKADDSEKNVKPEVSQDSSSAKRSLFGQPKLGVDAKEFKTRKVITFMKDLTPLGNFKKLDENEKSFKMIAEYVSNSHDCGAFKIHEIFYLKSSTGSTYGQPRASGSGAATGKGESKPNRMLLWYKTTPGSVKPLAQHKDGPVAFYDRVARALAVIPEDLKAPLRQTILLCSVSLGNVRVSTTGYEHWKKKGLPSGFNSVSGVGSFTSDWKARKVDDSVTVPLGKTVKSEMYSSSKLKYTEYIVFKGSNVRVKYAVDLEVFPGSKGELRTGLQGAGVGHTSQ